MKDQDKFIKHLQLHFKGLEVVSANVGVIRLKTKLGVVVKLNDFDTTLYKAFKKSLKPVKERPNTLTELLKREFGGAFYYIDKRANHYRLKTSFHVSQKSFLHLKKLLKGVEGLTISLETLPDFGRSLTSDRVIIKTTQRPSQLLIK